MATTDLREKPAGSIRICGTCHRGDQSVGTCDAPPTANNPQQRARGFEGEPPEELIKDLRVLGQEMGLHEDASFNCI